MALMGGPGEGVSVVGPCGRPPSNTMLTVAGGGRSSVSGAHFRRSTSASSSTAWSSNETPNPPAVSRPLSARLRRGLRAWSRPG
jgi:hypothetical protein